MKFFVLPYLTFLRQQDEFRVNSEHVIYTMIIWSVLLVF